MVVTEMITEKPKSCWFSAPVGNIRGTGTFRKGVGGVSKGFRLFELIDWTTIDTSAERRAMPTKFE